MKKQPTEKTATRINIITEHRASAKILPRQSPKNSATTASWKNLQFVFNQPILANDIAVVWHYPPYKKNFWHALCRRFSIPYPMVYIDHPRGQKIHIQTEPMTLPFARVAYGKKFLSQFGTVVAQRRKPKWYRGNWVESHGGLEWWYGFSQTTQKSATRVITKNWQKLLSSPTKNKDGDKILSIIVSRQHRTRQQKRRVAFTKRLSQDKDLQPMLDIFGSKRKFIKDKSEGLEKYKYHIALENALIPDYWTEKLADPLLAESFVFYAGATNIKDYFNNGSIKIIDISQPKKALAIIKQTINNHAYEKNLPAIKANKNQLMMEENLFNLIWRICKKYGMA